MTEHVVSLIWDAWRTRKKGADAIAQRRRARLADMVAHARANSPYHGELYRGLPDRVESAQLLPVTDKKMLMERFDEWCTDRAVTLEAAEAHGERRQPVGGEWFLGKYTVMTTSGTTGRRGIFLVDDRTMAVVTAMMLRWVGDWLSPSDFLKIIARRGRMAMVMATGGHFASAVAAARLKKRRGKRVGVLSAHMPLAELVARLNRFQPAMLAPYASMAAMLADEQEAGRLDIHPVLLALSAEGLPQAEYGRIARVFDAKVGNSYAASECMFMSAMCGRRLAARQRRLGGVRAGRRRLSPGRSRRAVAHSPDQQSRQSCAADPALRPLRQCAAAAGPVPMRQSLARYSRAGALRRRSHVPHARRRGQAASASAQPGDRVRPRCDALPDRAGRAGKT